MLKSVRTILYRLLKALVVALLVYGFVQTLPLDIALLLAGDTFLYFEVATAVWLAAQVMRFRHLLLYLRLGVARPLRRRAGRALRSARRRLTQRSRTNDDEGGWGALAPA